MEPEDFDADVSEETPEEQMANDEISPEEEGFMKGYDEGGNFEKEFDLNSEE